MAETVVSHVIDFSELPDNPPGEALEKLARELGKRLELHVVWTGRGADGGKDLLFSEIQRGPLGSRPVKWLVNCKHNAVSGKSVSESDVGLILEKVRQHKADGFLLITTTFPGVALKELLDSLDYSNGGEIYTNVWDSHELTSRLMQDENHDLLKVYLPESFKNIQNLDEPHIALSTLQQALPPSVAEEIRSLASPHLEKRSAVRGQDIWPYDKNEAELIDDIVRALIDEENAVAAVDVFFDQGVEFDAYMAMLKVIYINFPDRNLEFLTKIVEKKELEGVSFNAFQFILENHEIIPSEQIRLASKLDGDSLEIIYGDEIRHFISVELIQAPEKYELWERINELSGHSRLDDVYTNDLEIETLEGKCPRIIFSADVSLAVELSSGREALGSHSYPGQCVGYFDENGMFLESANIDTSEFYE